MEKNVFSLEGRVAIVTGGATGLGLGITKCMIKAGARVIAIGSRPAEKAEEALKPFGEKIHYVQHQITDTEHTQELTDRLYEEYGHLDILVNNAGNHCKKPIEEMSVEEFESVLKVHLTGAFALSKAVIPYMKRQRSGSILFQASMTSYIGQPYVTGYAAAKAGYLGMIHVLTAECAEYGVRVNGIAPGWIDTPMFHQATDHDPKRLKKIMERIPMKTTGVPEDIGNAAVFLCSDAARYISGVCLPVDGGALIGF